MNYHYKHTVVTPYQLAGVTVPAACISTLQVSASGTFYKGFKLSSHNETDTMKTFQDAWCQWLQWIYVSDQQQVGLSLLTANNQRGNDSLTGELCAAQRQWCQHSQWTHESVLWIRGALHSIKRLESCLAEEVKSSVVHEFSITKSFNSLDYITSVNKNCYFGTHRIIHHNTVIWQKSEINNKCVANCDDIKAIG